MVISVCNLQESFRNGFHVCRQIINIYVDWYLIALARKSVADENPFKVLTIASEFITKRSFMLCNDCEILKDLIIYSITEIVEIFTNGRRGGSDHFVEQIWSKVMMTIVRRVQDLMHLSLTTCLLKFYRGTRNYVQDNPSSIHLTHLLTIVYSFFLRAYLHLYVSKLSISLQGETLFLEESEQFVINSSRTGTINHKLIDKSS